MKEIIYSRNAVYECLRAKRRQPIRLMIAEKIQEKGHIADILSLAKERNVPVERVQRQRLDTINPQHQGVVLEAGHYPYVDIADILDNAKSKNEPLFVPVKMVFPI